ncbi:unnamed protein product, partial [Ectocarpus sp. 12 AP-2014]
TKVDESVRWAWQIDGSLLGLSNEFAQSSCGEEVRLARRGRAGAEGQGLGHGGQAVQTRDVSR